ncbi:MAG: transporter [Haliscomenobacter sp.]|nr:transporter [Haliscomenobacter sp.]
MPITRMRNRRNPKPYEENDLGFGTKVNAQGGRLLDKDGSFNIQRIGRRLWTPYQNLVEMPWPQFLGLVFLYYLVVNALFGVLFYLSGLEGFNGAQPGHWLLEYAQLFFFSIQTFTTVGYGGISPQSPMANALAALDALVGILTVALATGLIFARFSRPKANILFSRHALIGPYLEGSGFFLRLVNGRHNKLINLQAKVIMTWSEGPSGQRKRRFATLPLERDQVVMFPLNWTLVHPIQEDSPLYQKGAEELQEMEAEIIVLLEGYDETFAQTVHSDTSYTFKEIVCNARFKPMYHSSDGKTVLELDLIDAFEAAV